MEKQSNEDLQKAFEEEIKKPYYKVDYLDNFKLPYEKLDVSVIIPTYNRSPYKPGTLRAELNPLSWAIKSALLQKPKVKEIIVVDDHSDDYTKEVVDSFKKEADEKSIRLLYVRNNRNRGNAFSRNIGSVNAKATFLFFTDDDCIFTPYTVFGAVYTFDKLSEKGINVAAINLPTYFRRSIPKKVVSKKEIGKIDFIRGKYTTNKDAFPLEYLNGKEEKKFLDIEFHILEPFPITNFNTFSLCLKNSYQDVGGFKEGIIKRGIDREFGCQLTENGYLIYFQPDPKFHCVHGSYGLKTGIKFEGPDWFRGVGGTISLKRAMNECDKENISSGMRISIRDYILQAIMSFFILTYPRNKRGAMKWIEKVFNEFVVKGSTKVFGGADIPAPNESERKKIWKEAIKRGFKFIKKRELKEFELTEKIFREVEEEKRSFDEALESLGKI